MQNCIICWAKRGAAIVLVGTALTACGGAGDTVAAAGGGGTGTGTGTLACALTGCEIAKLPPTSAMPIGSANYLGRASVTTTTALGEVITTNADLAMTANFDAQNLSVTLNNIQTGATALSGSATGGGSIDGNTFAATYAGPISGSMTGNFRGTNAAALMGEMTITGGGATGGDAYGQLYANRQ